MEPAEFYVGSFNIETIKIARREVVDRQERLDQYDPPGVEMFRKSSNGFL
jgi:hypothetical protein